MILLWGGAYIAFSKKKWSVKRTDSAFPHELMGIFVLIFGSMLTLGGVAGIIIRNKVNP